MFVRMCVHVHVCVHVGMFVSLFVFASVAECVYDMCECVDYLMDVWLDAELWKGRIITWDGRGKC